RHHLEFLPHTHAGFFQHLAEPAVDNAMRRKIVHSAEAHVFHLEQPMPHAPARVGGVHAADHGDLVNHWQHFMLANFHGDGVGITVVHQPTLRAAPSHAEAARVVDDNEVRASFFDEFGADAGPGPGGNDRLSLL